MAAGRKISLAFGAQPRWAPYANSIVPFAPSILQACSEQAMSISAKRAFLFELRRSARCSIGRWRCPAASFASNILRHESAPQFGLTQLSGEDVRRQYRGSFRQPQAQQIKPTHVHIASHPGPASSPTTIEATKVHPSRRAAISVPAATMRAIAHNPPHGPSAHKVSRFGRCICILQRWRWTQLRQNIGDATQCVN